MRVKLPALILAALVLATPVHAAGLSGMGKSIYGNNFNFKKANLEKAPVNKDHKAGKLLAWASRPPSRTPCKKAFGGTIQADGDATWLCYHAADTNTWFISNAFGGQEFVMMVAVEANTKMPSDCEEPNAKFSPPVFDVPTIGAKQGHFRRL